MCHPRAPVRSRSIWLGSVALVAVTALAAHAFATGEVEPRAAAALQKFLARPAAAHQYSAWRRLEASGSGQSAWLDAQTDFTPDDGLLYEVTAEGGSRYIRARVLRSLLEEERRLSRESGGTSVAITRDNYHFIPEGLTEDGHAVIAIMPLRKHRSLVVGRMFLTVNDGDLVRLEGRLARNPSFWVSRVNIVRSYRRLNDVSVPVSLDTTAQLRLLGSSALTMTYVYSVVDERPVRD